MDKANNTKLGVFVILITAIFTLLIYQVSGGAGLLNNTITIYAEFENVNGLLTGNNVRYSGVKVGTVSDITVKSDNTLTVSMSLNKEVLSYMKKNALAEIGTNGLVGNMLVNISPSSSAAELIKDGDHIDVNQSAEIKDMLEILSTSNENIAQITASLVEITNKLNNGSGTAAQLINDDRLAKNINTLSQNLRAASSDIVSSTSSLSAMLTSTKKGEGNLGYLLADSSLKSQISNLSYHIDSVIFDQVDPIMQQLNNSSFALSNSTEQLDSIITGLGENKGLLGSLLNDTTIMTTVKSTLDNLDNGTQKFDESMEALQHNWLLRGFFKKKAKKEAEAKKKELENSN